jgi:hypothetical protein
MDQAIYNKIVSFIWGIADNVLRDVFVRGKYRDVILPMCVLRRRDAVLEPAKKAVLETKEMLGKQGITEQRAALCDAAGQAFYNTSKFTLHDLKSRGSEQQLRQDFENYHSMGATFDEACVLSKGAGSGRRSDSALRFTDTHPVRTVATFAYSTQILLCWHVGRRLLNENLRAAGPPMENKFS